MAADDDVWRGLARDVVGRFSLRRPVLLGIAGGVAVGKSTTADAIGRQLVGRGLAVEIVGTDAFLLPNAELDRRGLSMRKGFPESFDASALESCLRALRQGETAVEVPVYSHDTYDRVPGATHVLGDDDVVIVEGVNVLQSPVVEWLDLSLYVDADEADMRSWFLERFLSLCEQAGSGQASFYRWLAGMSAAQRRSVGEAAWDGINAVNLRDRILPSRARASYVLRKGRDHRVVALARQA